MFSLFKMFIWNAVFFVRKSLSSAEKNEVSKFEYLYMAHSNTDGTLDHRDRNWYIVTVYQKFIEI